jgi:hypothetical protein
LFARIAGGFFFFLLLRKVRFC